MPSKSNKKKAAAERSARLAAESGVVTDETTKDVVQANNETAAPVETPPEPTTQLSSLSVSSTPAQAPQAVPQPAQEKAKLIEYLPPAPLMPLQANKPIKVITNSYKMEVSNVKCYRYDVNVRIEKEGKDAFVLTGSEGSNRQKQADLAEILKIALHQEGLGKIVKVYDGATTLYSATRFNFKQNDSMMTTVEQSDVSESLKNHYFRGRTHEKFSVLVEPNRAQPELVSSDLLRKTTVSNLSSVAQMLHIALGEEAKAVGFLMTEGGSEMFDRTDVRASGGVELMHGIGAGIKLAKGEDGKGAAHVVLDYKKKRFFANGPLADLPINWNNISTARSYVKGLRVINIYTNQSFVIDGLSNVPMVDIAYENGTVLKDAMRQAKRPESYFNHTWPAVQKILKMKDGQRKLFCFPIENLVVAPNQKLGPKHGEPPRCDKPLVRFQNTKKIGEKAFLLSENRTLGKFGVTINPAPIVVDGFTVPTPKILYKGYETAADISKQASWQLANNRTARGATLIKPTEINEILILFNSSERFDGNKINELEDSLTYDANQLGVKIKKITVEDLKQRGNSVEVAFENKMNTLRDLSNKPMVVYLNQSSDPKMHAVLKLQERLCQVATQQLAFDKSLRNLGFSTKTNIFLKLNLKAGGLNHKVRPHQSISHLWGDTSNTLIISYDVCFSSGRVYKKGDICEEPSCVGFGYNGTTTPDAVIGDFHYQLPRREQVDADLLTIRARFMLNQYFESRNKLPDNVIIMRDGVSEGQHGMVMSEEFPAIQKGIMQVFHQKKRNAPSFALLVVTKRHANRLYMEKGGVICNVPPLTAVDRQIVRKNGTEIIFEPHGVIEIKSEQMGTAQPIVINMLLNEKVFKTNDEIVQLMAVMCCAHQASTKIISLPETIYAADEYAKRGADLFQSYKQKCLQDKISLPKNADGAQLDFMEITKTLCYHTSCFKTRRIA